MSGDEKVNGKTLAEVEGMLVEDFRAWLRGEAPPAQSAGAQVEAVAVSEAASAHAAIYAARASGGRQDVAGREAPTLDADAIYAARRPQ